MEDLNEALKKAEDERKSAQDQSDKLQEGMNNKTNVIGDPHDDRAKSTQDKLDELEKLNEDIRDKEAKRLEMEKQRDKVMQKKLADQDRADIQKGYEDAAKQYDALSGDLEDQIKDIEEADSKVADEIKDREDQLKKQQEELAKLKDEKAAQSREISKLDDELKHLNDKNEEYKKKNEDL